MVIVGHILNTVGGISCPLGTGNSTGRDCNPVSTGAILLADILPAIAVKLLAPYIHVPVSVKVFFEDCIRTLNYYR